MKSFLDYEIYKVSIKLATRVHHFTFKLPSFEKYEMGSQIRRASKSIPANIAEGFGRKEYAND